jgi:uncharacterized protein YndB with AHSA1/START domain
VNEVEVSVDVPIPPLEAFELFTSGIDEWWRPGPRYWGSRTLGHRFEPWFGGRLIVVHDRETGQGYELGRIEAWEPGTLLRFTWRQPNWLPHEVTWIDVVFAAAHGGTRVTLRHYGFDAIESDVGCDVGYAAGWRELLGHYAESVSSTRTVPG